MADYKVIDAEKLDADLTTVADAIRAKGGTTEQLEFPLGMKQAVEAIQSGGSGEEFVGIKYSDFNENGLPQIIDASNLPKPNSSLANMFYRTFVNDYSNKAKYIYMPSWVTYLSSDAFQNCGNLEELYGDFSNVTTIGTNTFQNCVALKTIPYIPNLDVTSYGSFMGCKGLTEVKIYNKLSTFHANTFQNCTNITDIYVTWSENEVANAPWGASNATIHYNTVYDENHNPIV